MRIAVFGAGGFVGGWICEELSQRNDIDHFACMRQWASAVRLARRGIHIRQIDLEDADALPDLLTGVDVVINAAMPPPAREPALVLALYSACVNAGVRRFIQFSSAAIYGNRTGNVDETMAPTPTNDYGRGKADMESRLIAASGGSGPQVFILRPSIIYGPFSNAWTVRYAERIVYGRWRGLGPLGEGTCNLVHGQDVARAAIAAATTDVSPGAQILNLNAPEIVTWNQYIQRLGDALGVPDRATPSAVRFRTMTVAAEIMRMGAKLAMVRTAYRRSVGPARAAMKNAQATTKLYPSSVELRLLGRKVRYSAEQAARTLGITPSISLEEGLRQSVAWCRLHGAV